MNTKLKQVTLKDIDLLRIGNEINLVGTIWRGREESYLAFFPNNDENDLVNLSVLSMDLNDWKSLIRQTDLLETEILQKGPEGITKAIIRKSARQIDGRMQWRVFRRDDYRCRYCGIFDVPLTVDHIITWEEGGATIEENLLTCCSKCNKLRGNMAYEDWIKSPTYQQRKKGISRIEVKKNNKIVGDLEHLRSLRVTNIRSR